MHRVDYLGGPTQTFNYAQCASIQIQMLTSWQGRFGWGLWGLCSQKIYTQSFRWRVMRNSHFVWRSSSLFCCYYLFCFFSDSVWVHWPDSFYLTHSVVLNSTLFVFIIYHKRAPAIEHWKRIMDRGWGFGIDWYFTLRMISSESINGANPSMRHFIRVLKMICM